MKDHVLKVESLLLGCTDINKITSDYIIPAEELSLAKSYAKYYPKTATPKL